MFDYNNLKQTITSLRAFAIPAYWEFPGHIQVDYLRYSVIIGLLINHSLLGDNDKVTVEVQIVDQTGETMDWEQSKDVTNLTSVQIAPFIMFALSEAYSKIDKFVELDRANGKLREKNLE